MLETFEGDTHASFKLEGAIEIGLAAGGSPAQLTRLEFEKDGDLYAEDGSVRVTLRGPLGELRKLGSGSPAIASHLALVADEPDEKIATARLTATPALVAEMGRAASEAGASLRALIEAPAWLGLLFALERYEPEEIGILVSETIERE